MKEYNVKLYVGKTFVGEYQVNAYNEDNARELAWELAEMDFNSETIMKK